jgi:tripeptide aminopeptidase
MPLSTCRPASPTPGPSPSFPAPSRLRRRLLPGRRLMACGALAACAAFGPVPAPAAEVAVEDHFAAQIERLRADPRVQSAFEHVLAIEPRTRADHIELTEIPAPPFGEEARGARFAELLREAGLEDVTIDEVGNVIGRRPGTLGDRVVAYNAHLDTVFPEGTDVTVEVKEDGALYAPGIGDDTRGLVVVLGVLRALEHAGIGTKADVLFIGNVGEEGLGDLRGVKHLFRDGGPRIDAMIAVDGGDSSRIVYGGVGSHRYRITFAGPGGHSWGAFGLANPHHALGRAIALLDERAPAVTTVGPKTSYNIGRIGGGTSINSIPFRSWMEVDMRSGDQGKLDDIDAVLQGAVQDALAAENEGRSGGPALTVDVERVGTRPAGLGDPSSPLVQRAMAATQALGYEPSLQISSTDANLPISLGVPAVTMSRGGIGGNAHAPWEWWKNEDGHHAIQIGILMLLAEAGLAGDADAP